MCVLPNLRCIDHTAISLNKHRILERGERHGERNDESRRLAQVFADRGPGEPHGRRGGETCPGWQGFARAGQGRFRQSRGRQGALSEKPHGERAPRAGLGCRGRGGTGRTGLRVVPSRRRSVLRRQHHAPRRKRRIPSGGRTDRRIETVQPGFRSGGRAAPDDDHGLGKFVRPARGFPRQSGQRGQVDPDHRRRRRRRFDRHPARQTRGADGNRRPPARSRPSGRKRMEPTSSSIISRRSLLNYKHSGSASSTTFSA